MKSPTESLGIRTTLARLCKEFTAKGKPITKEALVDKIVKSLGFRIASNFTGIQRSDVEEITDKYLRQHPPQHHVQF
jgi:hypothetical protein